MAPPSHNSALLNILLVIDGIGLAIIAACTILEVMELWGDFFNEYASSNITCLSFWFSGKFCQLIGLICLIAFAASFQMFPELERGGMLMLTVGPVLNLCAYSLFFSDVDPVFNFNKRFTASEILELVGITILDLSLIDTEEYLILTAEIVGFMVLQMAALLDFDFEADALVPSAIDVRFDMVHASDCFGLLLLTVVAVGMYKVKSHEHQHHEKEKGAHKQPSASGTGAGDHQDRGDRDREKDRDKQGKIAV